MFRPRDVLKKLFHFVTVLMFLNLSDWSGKRDSEIREGEVLNSDCVALKERTFKIFDKVP